MRGDGKVAQRKRRFWEQATLLPARRRDALAAAWFVVLAVLFYAPTLAQWRAFPAGDFTDHFFPFSLLQVASLRAFELPIWNPYTYAGHPFLADVQAAVYYPLSSVLILATWLVADPAGRFYWLQVEVVFHVALSGWFAYLWTRDLTGSRWAGLVGGVAWAWSGYLNGYAPLQLAVLRTATWLPLIWWLIGRGWLRPNQVHWWIGATLAIAVAFLAGHSQTFMLLAYGTAAWVIALAVAHRDSLLHRVGMLMAAVLSAAALTAAQWLPSLEFARLSVRANVDYAFVSGGFAWSDLWQVLLPGILTQYSPLFIGVVGIMLGLLALFAFVSDPPGLDAARGRTFVPWRAGVAFCAILALLAWLAALGGNGPLYTLLHRFAPGWAWFRGQERAAVLVTLALCGLAAQGMALVEQMPSFMRRRGIMVAAAVVLVVTYSFGLLWQLSGQTALSHAQYLLVAGLTMLLGLAAAIIIALPGWSDARAFGLVILTAGSLIWATAGINQVAGSPAERVQLAPEVVALAEALGEDMQTSDALPARAFNEYRVPDDYGMQVHIEDVWGSSPLRLANYAALFAEFPLDRMWRLLGVEYVLTWRRELFGPSELLAEFPQAEDTTYLHRLPEGNPRAWMVGTVMSVDDEAAVGLLADHQFDLDAIALTGPDTPWSEAAVAPGAIQLDVANARANTLHIRAVTDHGGFLVVAENWMPGWEVTNLLCAGTRICPEVDDAGRAYFAPVRANLTQVGVWLPPGDTDFELEYRPQSVRAGIWISGATLLLLVALTLTLGAWQARPHMKLRVVWLGLLMLAFLLRCMGLATQELRGDEAFGYFFSLNGYGEIVEQTLDLQEPHPVASYWLQHLWMAFSGSSEFALRFTSTWYSVAAVALTIALACALAIRDATATVALLLMSISPYVIWHAQDARMYSMSLALTLASTVIAVRWWRAPVGLRWLLGVAYLLTTWLALHTHYFAVYVLLAQNLALLGWFWAERTARRWLMWVGLQALLLLTWSPWLWSARCDSTGVSRQWGFAGPR